MRQSKIRLWRKKNIKEMGICRMITRGNGKTRSREREEVKALSRYMKSTRGNGKIKLRIKEKCKGNGKMPNNKYAWKWQNWFYLMR